MKYAREIKIGVLATLCLFLLFFGFNFLKGVNIFSATDTYHGQFAHIHGLDEQATVYIRGYKVGRVETIAYDFAQAEPFRVDIAINKDIDLPQGTQMVLIADGLLNGMAIELRLPEADSTGERIAQGAYLPTVYEPGIMDKMQNELMASLDGAIHSLDDAIGSVDSLVATVQNQLSGDYLQRTLKNVDRISGDLTSVSGELKQLMNNQVPNIVRNADTAIANLNSVMADIKAADLKQTVAQVDSAVNGVNGILANVQPVLGHVDAAIVSADSLLVDLKAHPKRYVHFSVFGKKDKK